MVDRPMVERSRKLLTQSSLAQALGPSKRPKPPAATIITDGGGGSLPTSETADPEGLSGVTQSSEMTLADLSSSLPVVPIQEDNCPATPCTIAPQPYVPHPSRDDPRVSLSSVRGESALVQTNLSGALRQAIGAWAESSLVTTRFQVVMDLSSCQDRLYTILARKLFLGILRDIHSFDSSVKLMAWSQEHRAEFPMITVFDEDSSPLASFPAGFSKYVSAYRAPTSFSKVVWTKICLRHSCPVEDLLQNIAEFLYPIRWKMFKCRLQVEQSKTIGWLLYSLRYFSENPVFLASFESLMPFPIALFWRKISLFDPGTENQYRHALHVEVESRHAGEARAIFNKIYTAKSTLSEMPYNIRMHLIPELSTLYGSSKEKALKLCHHQSTFTREMKTATIFCLVKSTDRPINHVAGRISLRMAFLLSSLPKTQEPVFHSLTYTKSGEMVASLFPHTHDYGRMIVSAPVTFLSHFFGDQVKEFFQSRSRINPG